MELWNTKRKEEVPGSRCPEGKGQEELDGLEV